MPREPLCNYKLVDEFDSVDCQSKVAVYIHIPSSLRVVRIRCKEDETFFSFSFPTPPRDSSGVFHIIEHTVLCSSDNFPLKDPFNIAMAQTSCSFMNAMTYSSFTSYPASGKILHDLERIFLMYADAVFFPKLEKAAFLQEGVNIKCENGKIIGFDGVVYNEMSENIDARIEVSIRRKNLISYRNTPCQYESGGDVDCIPYLTYENYKKCYYDTYKFSSCTLFLYGDEACDYFLDLLDEKVLSKPRISLEASGDYALPSLYDEGDLQVAYFDAKDNKYPSFFMLINIAIEPSDSILFRSLGILSQALLSSSKSDLLKELLKSRSFKDISSLSGVEMKNSICVFTIGLDDVNIADIEQIKDRYTAIIRNAMRRVVKNRINKDNLLASIKAIKLEAIEGSSFHSMGIKITERVMRNPDCYKNYFDLLPDIEKIEKLYSDDEYYFDKIFDKYLASCGDYEVFVAYPDTQFQKKKEIRRAKIIQDISSSRSAESLKDDENTLLEFLERDEKVNVDDYFSFAHADELIKYAEYDEFEEYHKNGALCLFKRVDKKCLDYVNIIFDLTHLSDDDIKNISLLAEVLNDSAKMDIRDTFFNKLNFYAHELVFSAFSYTTVDGECKIAFRLSFDCLEEDIEKAMDYISTYINDFTLTEKGLKHTFDEVYSYFCEDSAALAPVFSYTMASLPLLAQSYYNAIISGYEFKDYILSYRKSKIKELIPSLKTLSSKVFCASKCTFHITAQSFDKRVFEKFSDRLFTQSSPSRVLASRFDKKDIYTYPITGNLSYSTLCFQAQKRNPTLDVLSSTIQNTTLWQNIRIKGGAYGARCEYGYYTGLFSVSSYRDPRFLESFDDFILSLDIKLDEKILSDSKNAFFTDLVNEPTLARKAWFSVRNYMMGITNELRKERFEKALSLRLNDALGDIDMLKDCARDCTKASVTSRL